MYIFISFAESFEEDVDLFTYSFAERVADRLFHKLGLRLNTKTRFFRLPEEQGDLISDVKKVSTSFEKVAPSEGEDQVPRPDSLILGIIKEVNQLQASAKRLDTHFAFLDDFNQGEILKEIYNRQVVSLLQRPEWNSELQRCIRNLDFRLLSARPRELVILVQLAGLGEHLIRYLLRLKNHNLQKSYDSYIIMLVLCQTGFQSTELLQQLGQVREFQKVVNYFERGCVDFSYPGYYSLGESKAQKINQLSEAAQVIEQMKLRRLAIVTPKN